MNEGVVLRGILRKTAVGRDGFAKARHAPASGAEGGAMRCNKNSHAEGSLGDHGNSYLAFEDISSKLIPFVALGGSSGKGKDTMHGSAKLTEIVEGETLKKCDALKHSRVVLFWSRGMAQGEAASFWGGEREALSPACKRIDDERRWSGRCRCAVKHLKIGVRKIFGESSAPVLEAPPGSQLPSAARWE